MYKLKDNDIFGTSALGFGTRIANPSYIDPNAAFKKRTEQNYERYANQVINAPTSITAKPFDSSKVNENAQFQEDYHRTRKETDLQSSIFYPPSPKPKSQQQDNCTASLANSKVEAQGNFGRRETMKREINKLPFNDEPNKGNYSRLFDMDERIRPKTEQTIPVAPLIPCKLQWDQHDSVRYSRINDHTKAPEQRRVVASNELYNIVESMSTVFNQEDLIPKCQKQQLVTKPKQQVNTLKKAKSQKQLRKSENVSVNVNVNVLKGNEPVEIKVLRGWDCKLMEGLSKQCRLNGTAILKFQSQEGGKVTLVLKRSERWENVSDWLRKDAKLKIRVINN